MTATTENPLTANRSSPQSREVRAHQCYNADSVVIFSFIVRQACAFPQVHVPSSDRKSCQPLRPTSSNPRRT
jgi:hypothetical protein